MNYYGVYRCKHVGNSNARSCPTGRCSMRNKLRIMNLLLVNVISFFSLDKHHSYLTLERTEILESTKMFRGDVYL